MTMTIKRSFFALAGLLFAIMILSSCGTQPDAGSTTTSAQPAATSAPASSSSNDYSNDYGNPTATPAASTSDTTGALIKTASVMVGGKSMMVLTDAKGMTLYYFMPDTASKIACTGGCAAAWPPLLSSGSSTPTADGSLPGMLAVLSSGANGSQVLYNGHPLYTYASDTAPGQATGQGAGGKWFVATPDLAKQS